MGVRNSGSGVFVVRPIFCRETSLQLHRLLFEMGVGMVVVVLMLVLLVVVAWLQ